MLYVHGPCIMMVLVIWIWVLLYNLPVSIFLPHFSLFFILLFPVVCCLMSVWHHHLWSYFIVFCWHPQLFTVLLRWTEWQCDPNFMYTFYFYLLVTFNHYPLGLNRELLIRTELEPFNYSDQVFLTNCQTSNFATVLFTWLNQSHGFRLTLTSMVVNHTGWTYSIFHSELNLNVTLHVKNRSHWSPI